MKSKPTKAVYEPWPGLRTFRVRYSEKQRLEDLADKLDAGAASTHDLHSAAGYLRTLARSPKALGSINSIDGRPRGSPRSEDMALDYAFTKRRYGRARGQAKQALLDVAAAWGVDYLAVKTAFTTYRQMAELRLNEQLERIDRGEKSESRIIDDEGKRYIGPLTELVVLLECSAEIRKYHGLSREKSRLIFPTSIC